MTLAWLRQLALKLSLLERYNEAKQLCEETENFGFLSPCSNTNSPAASRGLLSPFSPTYSSTGTSPASSTGGPSPSPIERKTSLGVACQKFLMLFLIAPEVSEMEISYMQLLLYLVLFLFFLFPDNILSQSLTAQRKNQFGVCCKGDTWSLSP